MIVKPTPAPADPTKVCKTCGHYDPILQICCARDMLITKADAEQWTCGDWEEELNVFTVSETIGMDPVNPEKVPLQPDDSIKFKASETIGCRIVNRDGITWATLRTRHCGDCLHQNGDEMCPNPGEPFKEGCKNWEPKEEKLNASIATETVNTDAVVRLQTLCDEAEPCKAKLTFQYEKQPVFGGTSLKELEEKQKEAQVQERLVAKEKGYRRGYMVAELHMMCDAASQLMPDRKPQWERLRNILEDALRAWWARNDQDKKESKP